MKNEFRERIVASYIINLNWKKICDTLDRQDAKNSAKLSFYQEINDLIFCLDNFNIKKHARLCIL